MFRKFIFVVLFTMSVEADLLNDKIINLIGQENYDLHNNLIRELTKDESQFVINKTLNYGTLLSTLKNEGLINLNLDEQTEITILFNITNSHKKGFKIIKDVLSNIGYSYYFTDFIKNTNGILLWQIRFKSDFMLDPNAINSELNKFSTNILDINKLNKTNWAYTIEVKNGILKDVVNIAPNEKNTLAMPLQPYVLSLNNASEMIIASSKSNNWIPKISFYDTDLNALGTIEMDRVYEGIKVAVPKNSKYVKIGDRYSLLNIKRGLAVTISTALKN